MSNYKKKTLVCARGRSLKEKSNELSQADKLKIALVTLDVDIKKLEREPKFMSILQQKSLGGLPQVLEAMRLSTDPTITAFIDRYDRMQPAFQEIVPWEA